MKINPIPRRVRIKSRLQGDNVAPRRELHLPVIARMLMLIVVRVNDDDNKPSVSRIQTLRIVQALRTCT